MLFLILSGPLQGLVQKKTFVFNDHHDILEEHVKSMLKIKTQKSFSKMMRCQYVWPSVLWFEVMFYFKIIYFWNFILHFFYLVIFILKISKISCDYKFYVFRHCFHICQFKFFSKLGNVVLLFLTLSTFALEIFGNFKHLKF